MLSNINMKNVLLLLLQYIICICGVVFSFSLILNFLIPSLNYYGPTHLFYLSNIAGCVVIFIRLAAFYTTDIEIGFTLFIISQFAIALEMVSTTAMPLMLISLWFPPEQRTFAQSINCLAEVIAITLSMLLGPIFVTAEKASRQDFFNLMMVCSCFVVLAIIYSGIFSYQAKFDCLPKYSYLTKTAQDISEASIINFMGIHSHLNLKCLVKIWLGYCVICTSVSNDGRVLEF